MAVLSDCDLHNDWTLDVGCPRILWVMWSNCPETKTLHGLLGNCDLTAQNRDGVRRKGKVGFVNCGQNLDVFDVKSKVWFAHGHQTDVPGKEMLLKHYNIVV